MFLLNSRERIRLIVGVDANAVAIGVEYQANTFSETLNALGGHETMHVLSLRLWGTPSGTWLNEGLAVYSDGSWSGKPLHALVPAMLDRGELVLIKDLVRKKRGFLGNDLVTYPETGRFVKFVYETHGRDAVKRLWQHKPDNAELKALEQEWLAMLRQLQASALLS